jgi:hypothetical protein
MVESGAGLDSDMGFLMKHRAAFVAVLGLVFAGLAASPAEAEPAPTDIVTPQIVDGPVTVAGHPLTVSAQLRSAGVPVPGVPMRLLIKPYGATAFREYTTTATNEFGSASVTLRRWHNTRVKWVFDGTADYAPSVSFPYTEFISTRVGIRVSDATPRVEQRLVVRGWTSPIKPGHAIRLYRGYTNRGSFGTPTQNPPVLLDTGVVRSDGTYRLVARFHAKGVRRLFVQVAPGDGNITGWSPYRWVTVG